jgi:hypothetical protein
MKFILDDTAQKALNMEIHKIRKMKGMGRKVRTEKLAWDSRRGTYIKKKHGDLK